MNPLSDVMGGWGIWETVNGEQKLTTECIENVIMMVPFSAVAMWTFEEKIGNGWKKILCNSGKIAFIICNGVQREHNKKLNNGLPILHKVPPKRDYGRYFCIMAEKGGTSHGGLTEKLSLFFHAKKQEVNAYGR